MKRLLLILAFCTGCSEPIPVYLNTTDAENFINPDTSPSQEVIEILDEGFGFWGLTYALVPPDSTFASYGALDLSIIGAPATDQPIKGNHHFTARCRRRIWVEPDGLILAHEIGHAFSLEHSDEDDNIMFPAFCQSHLDEDGGAHEASPLCESHEAGGVTPSEAAEWWATDDQVDDVHQNARWFLACADSAPNDPFEESALE